jgi:hypothetical protein
MKITKQQLKQIIKEEIEDAFLQKSSERADELDEGIEHMTPENIAAFIDMLEKIGTNLWPVSIGAVASALYDKYQENKREKERSGEGAPKPPRDDM